MQGLLTASIFDGWVIGLVAGKMGGGSVADGFKHSFALVALAAIMVAFSGTILGHPSKTLEDLAAMDSKSLD